MANKIQHGICNVHVAKMLTDGTASAAPTYDTPKEWPGAVQLTIDPDTNDNSFAADNNPKYWTAFSKSGTSGSIQMAYVPDDIEEYVFGKRKDSRGGLVELAGTSSDKFALGFQIEGDDSNRRVWYYNVTIAPYSTEHNTDDDNVDPDTVSADYSAAQVNNSGESCFRYALPDTATANYGTFFSAVLLPAAVTH